MTVVPSSISNPSVVDYGLESGLNTQQIIQAELQPYQEPETDLQNQQATLNSNVADYQQINSDLMTLQTDASSLATASGWNARQATSSDSSAVTATAAAGHAGRIPAVRRPATGHGQLTGLHRHRGLDLADRRHAARRCSYPKAAASGFASLAAGTGLTLGAHTIEVTQSSEAASTTGTVDPRSQPSGINITTGSNDTVAVTVNGTAYNLTIAPSPAGGYSGSALLTAAAERHLARPAPPASSRPATTPTGNLILSTVDQGSSQSLQVTGGDALGTLGLSTMAGAGHRCGRRDQRRRHLQHPDHGHARRARHLERPGRQPRSPGPSRRDRRRARSTARCSPTGSITATNVSTGNGSLADIVSNINAAGLGVTASSVQTGPDQFLLQLSSSTTGTDSALSVDMNAFASSSLGALNVASAGKNAEVLVGGAGGYAFQSQTNTVTGLLPGLSINLLAASANPVTVTVAARRLGRAPPPCRTSSTTPTPCSPTSRPTPATTPRPRPVGRSWGRPSCRR